MSSHVCVWTTLGIPSTSDIAAIRRAYAAKLKTTRPEDDSEGFQALRSAYEAALRFAKTGMSAREPAPRRVAPSEPRSMPDRSKQPQPTSESAPTAEDQTIAALRSAFGALHSGLLSAAMGVASSALDDILKSPALENVSLERRVEQEVADLLASASPLSDTLLSRVAERFGWTHPGRQLSLSPAMIQILTRMRDLQFLEDLRAERSPYAHAFRGLTRRKPAFVRWIQAHIHKAGRPGEYPLLKLIRLEHPTLLPMLDAEAVAWWDRLASRPTISLPLLLIGLIVTPLVGVINASANDSLIAAAGPTAVSAGVFAALILGKLYGIDWPRHRIRLRWPAGAPPGLRLGWFALGVGALLVTALLSPWPRFAWAFAAIVWLALPWAVIFRVIVPRESGSDVASNPFVQFLLYNWLAAMWWLLSAEGFPDGTAATLLAASLGMMIISSVGLPGMAAFWVHELDSRQRQLVLLAIACCSICSTAALWLLTVHPAWRPLAAALAFITVMLHRPMAALLSRNQQKGRFYWMMAGFVAVLGLSSSPPLVERGFMLTGVGLLLMTTVVLCLAMGFWNERRGVTVA